MTRRRFLGRAMVATGLALSRGGRLAGAAEESPRLGEVRGTALDGGAKGGSPAVLAGLALVLLPQSAPLVGGLERLRRQSRDSIAAFRSAIPEMRRLVEATIEGLRGSGRGDAIRGATVDGSGHFVLSDVPAGHWVLIGYRSAYVDRASRDTTRESGTFLPQPRLAGYHRVAVWVQAVTVEAGRHQLVELTDRNVWFEGVEERTTARERVPSTGSGRRSAR